MKYFPNRIQNQYGLYDENYKRQMMEIKDDLCKWRIILTLCIYKSSIVIISVFPKLIYRFNEIFIEILVRVFGNRQAYYKTNMERYNPRIAKTIFSKKNNVGGLTLHKLRLTILL